MYQHQDGISIHDYIRKVIFCIFEKWQQRSKK